MLTLHSYTCIHPCPPGDMGNGTASCLIDCAVQAPAGGAHRRCTGQVQLPGHRRLQAHQHADGRLAASNLLWQTLSQQKAPAVSSSPDISRARGSHHALAVARVGSQRRPQCHRCWQACSCSGAPCSGRCVRHHDVRLTCSWLGECCASCRLGEALCDHPAPHPRRQISFGHAGVRSSVRHGIQCELRACGECCQQIALRSQQFGLGDCATWGILGGRSSSSFLDHLL